MMGPREGACPNCGGPIEFRLGASKAIVCPWCRHSVARTDHNFEARGKVADLVPTAPVMAVGDHGTVLGKPFVVRGRLQLDHGKGPWDEWYVELPQSGAWGWLAKAQGNFYLTSPVEASGAPHYEQMKPGAEGTLPGSGEVRWTVTEKGLSRLLSAEGELPFPAPVGQTTRYVDIVGPERRFGTIDYGTEHSGVAQLYFGYEVDASELRVQEGSTGERVKEHVSLGTLSCSNCGGPIEIRVPDQTERVVCGHCHATLDFKSGTLRLLGQLHQDLVHPAIPLGRRGTLQETDLLCIGFMERCTYVEGSFYSWREYLLYSDSGYRWLLEDSGHWLFLAPTHAADIESVDSGARYQNRTYRKFSSTEASVRYVVGEFYWKVEQGESAFTTDYIAPPYILSEERTVKEIVWSHGTYLEPEEVYRAFSIDGTPLKPIGVAPCQPNRISLLPALITAALGTAGLGLISILLHSMSGPMVPLVKGSIDMPQEPEQAMVSRGLRGSATTTVESGPSTLVHFTEPFRLPEGCNGIEVSLQSTMGSGWIGVAFALIHKETGARVEFAMEIDRFHESGADSALRLAGPKESIGHLQPGTYTLRLDPRWARKPNAPHAKTAPSVELTLTSQSPTSDTCAFCYVLILFLPLIGAYMRRANFETRRFENSNL